MNLRTQPHIPLLERCLDNDFVALQLFIFKIKNNRFSKEEWQSIFARLSVETDKESCNKTALSMMAAIYFFSKKHHDKTQARAFIHRAKSLQDPFAYYVNSQVLYLRKLYKEADAEADLTIQHQCPLGYHTKALILMHDAKRNSNYKTFLRAANYWVEGYKKGNLTFCLYYAAKGSIKGWKFVEVTDALRLRIAKRNSEDALERERIDQLLRKYRHWGTAGYHVNMALHDEKLDDFSNVLRREHNCWLIGTVTEMLSDTAVSDEDKKKYLGQTFQTLDIMKDLNADIQLAEKKLKEYTGSERKIHKRIEDKRKHLNELIEKSIFVGDHCYRYAQKSTHAQWEIANALLDGCAHSASALAYKACLMLQKRLHKKIVRQSQHCHLHELVSLVTDYETIYGRFVALAQQKKSNDVGKDVQRMADYYHQVRDLTKRVESFVESFCAEVGAHMPVKSIAKKQDELKAICELMSQFEKRQLSHFQFAAKMYDLLELVASVEPSKLLTLDTITWLSKEREKLKMIISTSMVPEPVTPASAAVATASVDALISSTSELTEKQISDTKVLPKVLNVSTVGLFASHGHQATIQNQLVSRGSVDEPTKSAGI